MSRKIKIRSFIIGGFFTLFFVLIALRLYWIQVVQADELVAKAERAWSTDIVLPSTRGAIYDRGDSVLAWNAPAYTVAVNPKLIHERGNAREVVDGLAPLLGMESESQYRKLEQMVTKRREDGSFYLHVEVRNEGWKIDSETAEKIDRFRKENKIDGIYLIEEQKRYYPYGKLASHVLGYTDKENKAIMGIEYSLDSLLSGKDGKIHYAKDRLGYELPEGKVHYEPPVHGKSIRLTLDQNIQHYMEVALEEVYHQYQPVSAMAIAADPKTMEILGMVSMPNFDPNEYWKLEYQSNFYNHAISAVYEPGSTFKIVTLAAAVEEGVFNPNELYQSGRIRVADSYINDHNGGRGWGEITFLEGFLRSSNVAFVLLGDRLGGEKLRDYIEKFGFGQKTGIELAGEAKGDVNFNLNYPTEVATVTFGHGRLTVTALQQLAAVSAIANDGKLMRPYLVKEIIDSETEEVIQTFEPEIIRQVVSERTAKQVREYLELVVSDQNIGTGRRAYIEGYRVAGKTGTAQKVVDGKYANDRFVVSFVGFAPADDPQLALIVIVDDPKIDSYVQGGQVVAPVFRQIMEKSLRYLGVESKKDDISVHSVQVSGSLPRLKLPELVSLDPLRAAEVLEMRGLQYEILGSGHRVLDQYPAADTEISTEQRVLLLTEEPSPDVLPDLLGWSLRDALEVSTYLGIDVRVSGEGYVTSYEWRSEDGGRVLHLNLQPPVSVDAPKDQQEASMEPDAEEAA